MRYFYVYICYAGLDILFAKLWDKLNTKIHTKKMAPSKQPRYSHCNPEVKILLPTHQRCHLIKEAQTFTGKQINLILVYQTRLKNQKIVASAQILQTRLKLFHLHCPHTKGCLKTIYLHLLQQQLHLLHKDGPHKIISPLLQEKDLLIQLPQKSHHRPKNKQEPW